MKKVILLVLLFVNVVSVAQKSFVPASPYPITINQPDGTILTIVARGDEYNNYSITEDGYSVVKNNFGVYEYAERDYVGQLRPSGIKANNKANRLSNELHYIDNISKNISPIVSPLTKLLKSASSSNEPQRAFPSSGSRRVLMLLIEYPDLANSYSLQDFDNLMNQANYSGTGSFNDYYKTYSNNTLDITVDVFGWYVSQEDYLYYGEDNGDERAQILVREAVDAAEAAGIDFSQYDNDADNVVDNLMVVHSGPGAEEGSQTQYIWSHSWALLNLAVTYDGVYINEYVIQPETRSFGMVGIGVFCHEFGHALGLPDLYDTNGGSEGLGNWCLMAGGAWLGNESKPAGFSAWCREELGWTNPTVISASGNYSLSPAATTTEVYKMLTPNSNEYFLLENRYKTEFDTELPGSGMAIFHINTNQSGNTNENNKLVDLEEADGDRDLDREINRGDDGDIYPGGSGNTEFNDNTDPDAQTYDSKLTGISIYDIALDGSTVNFKLGEPAPSGPDLTFDSIQNNFVINNTNVDLSLRIENVGTDASGAFSVGYYLSASNPVTTSNILLGTDTYTNLSAGAYLNETFSFDISTIPSLPIGSYYVGYIIDYLGQVNEIEEGDNVYTHTTEQVQLTSLANLSFDSQQNSLQINGDNIAINMEVENNGSSAAASSRVGYYLSTDQIITTSDHLLGIDIVGVLNAGATSSESLSADVASVLPSLPIGQYYVGFLVDYLEDVDEDSENDNDYYFPSPIYEYCPTDITNINESICAGESIEFNGTDYTTAGTYSFPFTNQYGCDSIVNFILEVNQPNTVNLNVEICEGDNYQVGNSVYTESGFYTNVLTNHHGCDSTVNLNLEVSTTKYSTLEVDICEGETYQVGHNIFSESGEYVTTLQSSAGCDSIVTLVLHVHSESSTLLTETICEGETILVGATSFSSSGNYTVVLTNQFGCDSTVTLDLTVNPVHSIVYNETVCEGEGVPLGDSVYYESGTYADIFTNRFGCDSAFTLNLTVNPVDEIELFRKICKGESVSVGDSIYTTSGEYLNEFTNRFGCDSLVTLFLDVRQPKDTVLQRSICQGNNIELGGVYYSEAGTYFHTFTDSYGCDSTVTLHLSINPVHDTTITEVICTGDSVIVGTTAYKTSGLFKNILTNRFGCDSVVILDLTVNPTHNILLDKIICDGDSFVVGTSVYKTSGLYKDMFANRFGCDSLVILNLTVNPTHDTSLFREICHGDSSEMGGAVYNESGIFSTHLSNRFGCDSLVTLHLTVHPVHDTTLYESICNGDSVVVGNSVYKQTGFYTDILSNRFGCDSVVNLELTVNPVHDVSIDAIICEGDSYYLGGISYSTDGTYNHTFSNQYGCDSLVTVNLKIASLPDVFLGEDTMLFSSQRLTLDAGNGYDMYNWSTGANSPSIQIDKSLGLGENEVSVTVTDQYGCVGSDQIFVTIYNDDDSSDDNDPDIKLFPNPTFGLFNILLGKVSGKFEIRVLSENGAIIFSKEYFATSDKELKTLNLPLRSGMYTIMVVHENGVKVDKLIFQRR